MFVLRDATRAGHKVVTRRACLLQYMGLQLQCFSYSDIIFYDLAQPCTGLIMGYRCDCSENLDSDHTNWLVQVMNNTVMQSANANYKSMKVRQ